MEEPDQSSADVAASTRMTLLAAQHAAIRKLRDRHRLIIDHAVRADVTDALVALVLAGQTHIEPLTRYALLRGLRSARGFGGSCQNQARHSARVGTVQYHVDGKASIVA